MAQVPVVPGKTEIQLTARNRANTVLPQLLVVPGGLYPLKSAAFEVDEYRIMSGWPVPVPDCDIQIQCLVSGEGDKLTDRDSPLAITTDAGMRWVADSSYYDQILGQWTPIQGGVSPWETAPQNAPTLLTDYEYTIGDERFVDMSALNFDSDTADYMWNDLDRFMGGVSGYTVLMVMSPNSVYGNNIDVFENGLWAPNASEGTYDPGDGTWSSDKAWVSFTIRGQALWMTTESSPSQQGIPLTTALATSAPVFMVLVVHRPQTTLYVASGPSKVITRPLAAGQVPEPLSTRFWLGKAPSVTSATMDMALLDLSIYGDALTSSQVVDEIGVLAKVYGGDR
jgi:hypothetical protein